MLLKDKVVIVSGIGPGLGLEPLPWRRAMEVNSFGTMQLTRACVLAMKEAGDAALDVNGREFMPIFMPI